MKYVEKVDTKIENALFSLMEGQSLSTITTTQIVKKAEVSRASFYRNFDSKEEVIRKYIDSIMLDALDIIELKNTSTLNRLKEILSLIKDERARLIILLKQGYGIQTLQYVDKKALEFVKKSNKEISAGSVYIKIGAVFNLIMNWMLQDCKEEIEDLCKILAETIPDFDSCMKQNLGGGLNVLLKRLKYTRKRKRRNNYEKENRFGTACLLNGSRNVGRMRRKFIRQR